MAATGAGVTPAACPKADAAQMMDSAPMENFVAWPEAFEPWRLDDSVMAEAFDSLLPAQRAAIKTGIAMHCALHGEHSAPTEYRVHDRAKGFDYTKGQAPVAWTVLFIDPCFAAGPRLVAALMPAILAGVPLLAVACVGGEPSATVCACLELMGVEHVFCVPHLSAAEAFLHGAVSRADVAAIATARPAACALFLGADTLKPVYQAAQAAGLRCWRELFPPRIALDSAMAQAGALMQWCHPDASRVPLQEADALLYTPPEREQQDALSPCVPSVPLIPLILSTGLEGFWCYQELDPRYFLQKSLVACCIPDNFSKD